MKAWLIFLCLAPAVIANFSQEILVKSEPVVTELPFRDEKVAELPEDGNESSEDSEKGRPATSSVTDITEVNDSEKLSEVGRQKEEEYDKENITDWQVTTEITGEGDANVTTGDPFDQAEDSEEHVLERLNATEPSFPVWTTAGPATTLPSAKTTVDDLCLSTQCQARRDPWAACTGFSQEDEVTLSEALTEFAVEYYQKAIRQAKPHSNLVFSPISISTMLSNLLLGTCRETKDRLEKLLFYPEEFTCVHSALGSLSESKAFISANAAFFPPQLNLNKIFENLTNKFYHTKLKHLTNNSNQDVIDINVWVSQATNNKIKKLLDNLDPDVQMVLLNAVAFQSKWKTLFKPKNTKKENFFRPDLPPILVPMMTSKKYPVASFTDNSLKAKVARLQLNDDMSLVIILPRSLSQNLSEVEERLTAPILRSVLAKLQSTRFKPTLITLPKFKVDSSQDLMEIAAEMDYGIFLEADLCRISENEEVIVSSAQHRAILEINEDGVEAAAATSISLARVAHVLEVQQPFLFLVVDDHGTPAFMGRVHTPETP
uniref:Serpin family G member 1 n=1 Tax=Salvator merianae TaxID=96440 RepID=A0A8D0B6I2_SALMN